MQLLTMGKVGFQLHLEIIPFSQVTTRPVFMPMKTAITLRAPEHPQVLVVAIVTGLQSGQANFRLTPELS
jgi:hypothetical protein